MMSDNDATTEGIRQMSTRPSIVTPKEAQRRLVLDEGDAYTGRSERRLAITVATEPDRTRAAVVKALQHASRWVPKSEDRDALADYIRAIKSGADLDGAGPGA